ncbi:MAG: iron-sulfur cluster repair di-iron protein [Proteobacteria bacterium]|nr:iron-sulfur cluster repair di-iron protein [Pseudomonadota bacterium]MBU1542423.1 iron-sulfur cluster repair di-iron protein [Pseudomonadota bacterium]MBU2431367.1 iron-sulfur cluster repair di-iron protein [Pseudomonadota bacterium]MBU2482799.1 iron-sulfur cluster repair di-iron protein [Pseudomonadota bacterium]
MTQSTNPEKKNVSHKTIGEIVAGDYRTATVFEKHGIDFCCGGQVPLITACQTKDLDLESLQLEIENAMSQPLERSQNYAAWSLSFLADYIVNTHHAYLNEEMGLISAYLHKIVDVHGTNHPELVKIATIFDNIVSDMTGHLHEEEEILFPAIKRVEADKKNGSTSNNKDCEMIKTSLEKLYREHEEIGDAVHEIRRLSNDYAIPADVCNTFMLTYRKLKEFEDDLHKHVHLENNILFLKAGQP